MPQHVNRLEDQQESFVEAPSRFVHDHALSSTLISYGVGVAAGLAVACLFSDPRPSRKSAVSERLGSHLLESLSSVIPNSLKAG